MITIKDLQNNMPDLIGKIIDGFGRVIDETA